MAEYTIELGEILREYSEPYTPLSKIIENGCEHIFDFYYPFFLESERHAFEQRFLRKFFTREIGFETEELFKFQLESWMLINMPYFNKLFQSELLSFDPFVSYELTTEHEREAKKTDTMSSSKLKEINEEDSLTRQDSVEENVVNERSQESSQNSETNASSTDTVSNRKLDSVTPDSRLEIESTTPTGTVIEYASSIEENKGVNSNNSEGETATTEASEETTSLTREVSDSGNQNVTRTGVTNESDTVNQTGNDRETFTERRSGNIGVKTASEMLNEYRTTFIRIEKDLFSEMECLFMQVF